MDSNKSHSAFARRSKNIVVPTVTNIPGFVRRYYSRKGREHPPELKTEIDRLYKEIRRKIARRPLCYLAIRYLMNRIIIATILLIVIAEHS